MIFIRPTQNSNGFNGLTKVSRLLKSFVLILPTCKFLILDKAFHLFDSYQVLFNSRRFDVVINKVEFVDLIFELFKSKYDWPNQDGSTRVLSMMQGNVRILFIFNFLLGILNFRDKQVHNLNSFLFDTCLDAISFCQVIEGFEHVNSLLDSGYLLEGEINDVLIHHIQLFNSSFEGIVLLVPIGSLDIQYLILLVRFKLVNQLNERPFDLKEDPHYLWGSGPSKFRKLVISSFQSKLKLALANFNQLRASLDESFNRCEYWVSTELPFSFLCTIDDLNKLIIDLSPFFTTLDSII